LNGTEAPFSLASNSGMRLAPSSTTLCTPSPVMTRLETPTVFSNSPRNLRGSGEVMERTLLPSLALRLLGVSQKSSYP
ncbi:MAG: hypothetical protein WBD59_11665, partial [Candidatus Sulfotelmatobacter sp.]